jgi:hypothetical protein
MSKIKMIKKDAVVNVKIGTGFLKKIQEALLEISSNHTEEEVKAFGAIVESKGELTEPWMETVYTLSLLIRAIEEQAIEQNLTYEEDIDTAISQLES